MIDVETHLLALQAGVDALIECAAGTLAVLALDTDDEDGQARASDAIAAVHNLMEIRAQLLKRKVASECADRGIH